MKEDVHPIISARRTHGQKAADAITKHAGSWGFIISFLVFLVIWMAVNVFAAINRWDPYPFILLNLVLSCIAALQAPIILMSQNREAQRDRIRAEYDYKVNKLAEREIRDLKKHVLHIKEHISHLKNEMEKKR